MKLGSILFSGSLKVILRSAKVRKGFKMEEYVENKARDVCDASAAKVEEQDHGTQHQDLQIARQLRLKEEENQLANLGVFKATNGNAAKKLKLRQETRETTKASKTAIKQIATLGLQAEKGKMREWKQKIIQGVRREIQAIRQAYKAIIEAQNQNFQLELQRLRGQIKELESRSRKLENKMNLMKIQKQTLNQRSAPETPATKEIPTVPTDAKLTKEKNTANPRQKSYAQIAALSSANDSTRNAWTQVTSSNQRRKTTSPNSPKVELEKRRVIFRQELFLSQKSEADLMLAFNESLQKAKISAYIRFCRLGYSQSGAISSLLTEKSNEEELINIHSNVLIRVAKSVDNKVMGKEALERWQRLKIHGISLVQYLDERKMEMLCQEIELSTEIQLKTRPRWLINKIRRKERLESGNRRRSAIVITVRNSGETSLLCSKRLRFRRALKVVEKYWEAGPGSVCISYKAVDHYRLGNCGKRAMECVICAGLYKVKNHKYSH